VPEADAILNVHMNPAPKPLARLTRLLSASATVRVGLNARVNHFAEEVELAQAPAAACLLFLRTWSAGIFRPAFWQTFVAAVPPTQSRRIPGFQRFCGLQMLLQRIYLAGSIFSGSILTFGCLLVFGDILLVVCDHVCREHFDILSCSAFCFAFGALGE
jgi:hypothetical protein